MVMKPEPWGAALDEVLARRRARSWCRRRPGRPFTQAAGPRPRRPASTSSSPAGATRASTSACSTTPRRPAPRCVEVSLGDYVLNGGEVAALAVTEAVVRLLPGFMGNAASLVEESHEDGLLEYPVYTKPASWRGLDVPAGAAVRRPRPDRGVAPRPGAASYGGATPRPAARQPPWRASGRSCRPRRADAGELLTLQRACWLQEAIANDGVAGIPALHESLDDVLRLARRLDDRTSCASTAGWSVAVARPVSRATPGTSGGSWSPPTSRAAASGGVLLEHVQAVAPAEATSYVLFTGQHSVDNIRMYKKAGFRLRPDLRRRPLAVVLTKPRGFWRARPRSRCGKLDPWSDRPKVRPEHTRGGTASGVCHRGRLTPPATTVATTARPS